LLFVLVTLGAFAALPHAREKVALAHDEQRLADMHALVEALERYYEDAGRYPASLGELPGLEGDSSHLVGFLDELRTHGTLTHVPLDPRNDELYHYRYLSLDPAAHGAGRARAFYVLGLTRFESSTAREHWRASAALPERDFAHELEWSVIPPER
jgi:hypothetical protein